MKAVAPMIETAQKIFGGHMGNPGGALALSGTPETIKGRIQQHVDLGCTMFVMEFFGRDTVARSGKQIDGIKPFLKCGMRRLKGCARHRVNMMPAPGTRKGWHFF